MGYGTLRGHLIEGCEAMAVTWTPRPRGAEAIGGSGGGSGGDRGGDSGGDSGGDRGGDSGGDESGEVEFCVVSLSRGAGPLGKLIFPLIKGTQMRFFKEQCETMTALARDIRPRE